MKKKPHILDGKIEHEARGCPTMEQGSILSIAISMKRIADTITGKEVSSGIRHAAPERIQ